MHFVQTWVEIFANGNIDCFVLVVLAAAVLASARGREASSGVLIGLTGVLKTWPAAVGLVIFRRGYPGRRRALVGLVAALMFGPVLTLAFGGVSGFMAFLKATFDARSQQVLSFSVFATPFQLFARSGMARPVVVSGALQDAATLMFTAWVVGLLVVTLRWSDSTSLAFWNVMGCVVLLVPVSHNDYTLYFLPILWIWVARWLEKPRLTGPTSVICGMLVVWWAISSVSWYTGAVNQSSLRIAMIFFANLGAVTVSVLGDHIVKVRSDPGSMPDVLDDMRADDGIHAPSRVSELVTSSGRLGGQ